MAPARCRCSLRAAQARVFFFEGGEAAADGLDQFDYLSSVSGGGYIHSWLAAWLKRTALEERDINPRAIENQN
jgi:hypothetical protein